MWWKMLAIGLFLIALPAAALDPSTRDPDVILRAAFDQQRAQRTLTRMKMTIRDSGGTRERTMVVRSKRFADARKSLISIEQPADVRNTGFLSVDYSQRGRADEQWLYLPKLHRVTRVPNSGKADAFVGSDFSISDLAGPNPDSYTLKLLEAAARAGHEANEECWLIEATPRDQAARDETGYARTQIWVSKGKLVPIQIKAWLATGSRIKYFKASDVRNVAGVWTAHRLQMRTLDGSNLVSETLIDVLSVDNDAQSVVDADFTQQRLAQGV